MLSNIAECMMLGVDAKSAALLRVPPVKYGKLKYAISRC